MSNCPINSHSLIYGIKVADEPIGSVEMHCADVPKAAGVRWAVSKLVCNYRRANKVLIRRKPRSFLPHR